MIHSSFSLVIALVLFFLVVVVQITRSMVKFFISEVICVFMYACMPAFGFQGFCFGLQGQSHIFAHNIPFVLCFFSWHVGLGFIIAQRK